MGALKDLTGLRFGSLLVQKRVSDKGRNVMWQCLCDCGKTKNVSSHSLSSGNTKSCGHCKAPEDISGRQFGQLTVQYPIRGTYKDYFTTKTKWHCLCSCGNECNVYYTNLVRGITQSCGCIHTKMIHDKLLVDISQNRFGRLTAIRYVGSNKYKQALWLCKCDCGNLTTVASHLLRYGSVQSCGCLKSHGEQKIKNILQENKISFVSQKIFDDCIFKDTKKRARFDFYVEHKYCIEYDGILHYETKNSGWNNEKNFVRTKERDFIKNNYCKEHNIPLIRIPYYHLEELCLDDLRLETSQFIVT